MNVNLNLTDPKIQKAIQTALILGLSEEAKQTMIQEAVKYLVTPTSNGYNSTKESPLGQVFKRSVESVASQWIREEIDKPDSIVRKQMQELTTEVVKRMLDKTMTVGIVSAIETLFQKILNRLDG